MRRTPKPLEAAILLVLAAVVERNYLNFCSEEEIIRALHRAGHHPSKNVFRLAVRRMDEEEMIVKGYRLINGRVYSQRELQDIVEAHFIKPEEARVAETVYGASGYYISELADNILEGNDQPPALSKNAIAAAALFCLNAWDRPAWAQKHCAQVV